MEGDRRVNIRLGQRMKGVEEDTALGVWGHEEGGELGTRHHTEDMRAQAEV